MAFWDSERIALKNWSRSSLSPTSLCRVFLAASINLINFPNSDVTSWSATHGRDFPADNIKNV